MKKLSELSESAASLPLLIGACSIAEFCEAYGISRSNFYSKRPPERPRTVVLGGRRLILLRTIHEWEERMLANQRGGSELSLQAVNDNEIESGE